MPSSQINADDVRVSKSPKNVCLGCNTALATTTGTSAGASINHTVQDCLQVFAKRVPKETATVTALTLDPIVVASREQERS